MRNNQNSHPIWLRRLEDISTGCMTIALTAVVLVLGFARWTHAFPAPRAFAAEPIDERALALFVYRRPTEAIVPIVKRVDAAAAAHLTLAARNAAAAYSRTLSVSDRQRRLAGARLSRRENAALFNAQS